jgi:hypothetical protein
MNETPEIGFHVQRLPREPEPGVVPRAYLTDHRGVMRRASEAEEWLWDELCRLREQLASQQEKRRGR